MSKELNYPLKIKSAEVDYFNTIELHELELLDIFNNKMVTIHSTDISFDLLTILNKEIVIEEITITRPHVKLIKNTTDGYLNFNEFIKAIQQRFKTKKQKKQNIKFKISSIQIVDGIMSYNDQRKDTIQNVFDYYHFQFNNINLRASNFLFENSISSFDVHDLNLYEPTYQKKVHKLDAHTEIGLDFIELSDLKAKIGESEINHFIRFDFENFKAFDDFNGLVNITTKLDKAKISSFDIGMFSSTIRNHINDIWTVSGDYQGKIINFKSNDFEIEFGDNSVAKGKLSFDGLPDFYNTFLDIHLNSSHVKSKDLAQYFPSKNARKELQKFGHIIANGSFTGFPLDFVAFGNFTTSLGNITSDINLKISEGREKAYYKGQISTKNFNLGKLTNFQKYVKNIDMQGKIEGNGLTLESANFNLNASIKKLHLLNYTYSNIITNGSFSHKKFDGDLSITDTNLNFTANGLIDFTREKPVIKINSDLRKSNLYNLKLSDVQSNISSKLDINIKGLDFDEIVGAAKFDDLKIKYDSNYLNLTSITLFSSLLNNKRSFSAVSPHFYYKMNGNYKFTKLRKDLLTLRDELILNLENDREKIKKYYASKAYDSSNYDINFYLKLLDINPLFELYNINLKIADNTELFGDFRQGNNTILTLNSEIENLEFNEIKLQNILVDLNSSKYKNKSDVLAIGLIESENQKAYGFETERLHTEAVWSNDQLELESFIKQKNSKNHLSLKSAINFEEELTNIKLNDFSVLIYDQIWEMVDSNSLVIKKDEIEFNNLQFGHDIQTISLTGIISKEKDKKALLKIENFNLDLLNPVLPQPISGITQFNVHLQDMFGKQKIYGNCTIDSLNIANNNLGRVIGKLDWDKHKESGLINMDLYNDNKKLVNINGQITPFSAKNNFDLKATIIKQALKIAEPYFKAYASKFDGKFDGNLTIQGKFNYPILNGEIHLHNASFNYDYLNVTYFSSDKINLSKDLISFNNVTIKDRLGNKGTVNGYIKHHAFKNYTNNLSLEFNNLLTLNTSSEDNTLYFGKIFATGNAKITGPTNDVTIKADAITNKNSEIYIPLNGYEGVEDKDFIKFISFNDVSTIEDTTSTIDLTGINMDFNFGITEDAYMEIIFDPKAGDIIRGNGHGDLNLVIDTRGEFNVYGDYEIKKGTYNFTLMDIVNKEFTINEGSTVNWSGDPYAANLGISAKYQQRASLGPIVIDTSIWIGNPSFKYKKYATDVLLNLNGDLLHPEIVLDIDINDDYPIQLQESVNSFENEIKNNEQELNRQVFSLIILKQFAQRNSLSNLNIGASAGRSMSELISNQLSFWMSQVDDNLEIDLDLGSLSAADNSSYQLRLSYSLLDGRLRLSNQTDYDKGSDLSTVTGEWTVEYMLTKDGKLRLKMYNRTSQNNYSNNSDNSTYNTAGASILYTKGFNSLKELFMKKDKKEKK